MKNKFLIVACIVYGIKGYAQTLSVTPSELNYGVIKKGSEGTRQFTVANKGNAPLVITNCQGSCGCTVPTCPKEPIMPRRSATINVHYDTNRPGPFTKMVTVNSNDTNSPTIVLKIMGEVQE
jgi:hypothetical protein